MSSNVRERLSGKAHGRPSFISRARWVTLGPALLLVLAALFMVPHSPFFIGNAGRSVQSLAIFSAIFAIAAYSVAVPLRFLALPSAAQMGLVGVGAYTTGLLITDLGWSFWPALVGAVTLAAVIGAVVGALALRTEGLPFLIITVALGGLIALIINNWDGLTHGVDGLFVTDRPAPIPGLDMGDLMTRYYVVLAFLAAIVFLVWMIARSHFGRRLIAIRDDETLARSLGMQAFGLKLLAFTIAAAFAGVAGHLYLLHLSAIDPELFTPFEAIPLFLMVVLGGTASLAGPAVGAWFVHFLPEWLAPLAGFEDPSRQRLLFGVLLVVVVLVLPIGIIGWIEKRLNRVKERWQEPEPPQSRSPSEATASAAVGASPATPVRRSREAGTLELESMSKSYGAVQAVDGVSLTVGTGEIVGLIGPNGSGKTSLLNCISGFQAPSSGRVHWRGHDITSKRPESIAGEGVMRTFQQPRHFESYTPREHFEVVSPKGGEGALGEMARFGGLTELADSPASDLSFGQQRNLSIAMALATGLPDILMLDEPAAGLNDAEAKALRDQLFALRDEGMGLLVIDHDMGFLLPMCERVIVLDAGAKIAEGPPNAVRNDPRVVAAYLGDRFSTDEEVPS